MAAAQPAAPAGAVGVVPARGFCHQCEEEVLPHELGDGSYQCPRCSELCVECPYESFEFWQGTWRQELEEPLQVDIDEHGVVSVAGENDAPDVSASLIWAPGEEEGYFMRLNNFPAAGARQYLRLEPGGGALGVRQRNADGSVVEGVARRAGRDGMIHSVFGELLDVFDRFGDVVGAAGAGEEAPPAVPGGPPGPGVPPPARTLQQTLDQRLERLVLNMPGLGGEERENFRAQLRQVMAPLAGILAPNEDGQAGTQGPGVFFAPLPAGMAGVPGAGGPGGPVVFNFGELFNSGIPAERRRESGVPESILQRWFQGRTVPDASGLEADWSCPICFDSCEKDLVYVCKDGQDRPNHVFHRDCVQGWLVRRNECPSCRRTPVVERPQPTPLARRPFPPDVE